MNVHELKKESPTEKQVKNEEEEQVPKVMLWGSKKIQESRRKV